MLCRKNREGEREGFDREPVDSLALVALYIKKVLIEPRAGPDKAIFSLLTYSTIITLILIVIIMMLMISLLYFIA